MNALDSYAMGKYQYDQQNFGYASQWIFQAIDWLMVAHHTLPLPLDLDRSEVLRLYAESLIQMSKCLDFFFFRILCHLMSLLSLLDRYADALKVINSAIAHTTDKVKLLLRKSEVETLIRMEPKVLPRPVCHAPYRTLIVVKIYRCLLRSSWSNWWDHMKEVAVASFPSNLNSIVSTTARTRHFLGWHLWKWSWLD